MKPWIQKSSSDWGVVLWLLPTTGTWGKGIDFALWNETEVGPHVRLRGI